MGTKSGRPGGDPPVRAELLHDSERTRVTRLFLAGRTVIRKEPLGPDSQRRLRHELAMLERLRGVVGVAQLLEAPSYPGSIVLEDVEGSSLAQLSTPLEVGELTDLALRLAHAVAATHRCGVIHRHINPANVMIAGDGAPCLVGFASATSFAEIRPEFTHHTQIAGDLAYLAPEQSGRTGRRVDERADLYALGATPIQTGNGRATLQLRRRVAAHARSFGPAAGATIGGEPRHSGAALGDRHASAREGTGQPVPDRGERGLRPGAVA
jgi:serine/threonine protein kinase